MSETADFSYDKVLYPSYTHTQTHPDRLATLATLLGMKPAPVERCSVLELGCGNGSNLVPMAYGLPESEFTGIDLAARPIASGQATIEALGLKNIKLSQFDVMNVTPDFGQFDYIIAHGLYSWTPPPVRDKILAICKVNLAPQGVAFVSYNAYPGAHLQRMVRGMMLFHVRNFSEPQEQINQAIALAKFLAESQPTTEKPDLYRLLLKEELEEMIEHSEGHIYHDELAEINEPVYFHQFMEHAARHDLQFLSESEFYETQAHIYPPQVVEMLRGLARKHIVLKEQYLDFLKCRRFRQTLLCHEGVALERDPKAERVMNFYFASIARPVSEHPDISSAAVEEFRGARGGRMATDFPLAKAAMLRLGEIYPQPLHFNELLAQARARLGPQAEKQAEESEQEAQTLAEILLGVYAAGILEMHAYVPRCALEVSERPVASPLARFQIQSGNSVATLRHTNVSVEDVIGQRLLALLDGTRDRAALIDELQSFVKSDVAARSKADGTTVEIEKVLQDVSNDLENNLTKLARLGLLIA